jgi:preprotein translocase subunit SecF
MSINAVLPRTIMTATTVFLALLSLAIFGGQVIRSFSLAMIWGIVVATYSSVFICSPMLIYLGLRNEDSERAGSSASEDAVRKPEKSRNAELPATAPAKANPGKAESAKPSGKRAKPSTA